MVTAGSVLRDARQRAGLSQVELAQRAGVTQSVVSAYESGVRQPSVPMLERLVAATGFELDVQVRHAQLSDEETAGERLRRCRRRVKQIVDAHGLSNVRVFGSVVRGEARSNSDVDLLVDVGPGVGLLELGRCQAELEVLLGVRVDLVPADDLKTRIADDVLREARPL